MKTTPTEQVNKKTVIEKKDEAAKRKRVSKEEKGPQGPNYNTKSEQEDGNTSNNAGTFK